MAEKQKKYVIKIPGQLVEVTEEIYLTYYRMRRRELFLEEKDMQHGISRYSDLDTEEILGEEMIPDRTSEDIQDTVVAKLMTERLQQCLRLLPDAERELIHALYFEGLSERQLSKRTGLPQKTINDRKHKALRRLKNWLERPKKFRST